jgi:hypothetical protein
LEYAATAVQPKEEHLKQLAEAGYKTIVEGWSEKFGPAIDHFSIEGTLEFVGMWKSGEHDSPQARVSYQ